MTKTWRCRTCKNKQPYGVNARCDECYKGNLERPIIESDGSLKRKTANPTHVLLDPNNHPVGSRLILSDSYSAHEDLHLLYEATIVEWSPSGHRVKLKYDVSEKPIWIDCFHYYPMVKEILPIVGSVNETPVLKTKCVNTVLNNPLDATEFDGYLRNCAQAIAYDLRHCRGQASSEDLDKVIHLSNELLTIYLK